MLKNPAPGSSLSFAIQVHGRKQETDDGLKIKGTNKSGPQIIGENIRNHKKVLRSICSQFIASESGI